jgi:Fe2+ transport system protein FeoA
MIMADKKLSELSVGEKGVVGEMTGSSELNDFFLELGMGVDEPVAMVARAPMGDPIVIEVMNTRLSLRLTDAEKIVVCGVVDGGARL